MKNKKYILKIEDPCSEDWQTMDEEEISRFCNKCQKSVINFADMSDREIYNYLEKSDSKICGRFKNEQLNRPIINPNYNPNYQERSKYLPILAGMLLMTGNEIANATDSTSTKKVSIYNTPSSSQDSSKAITKSDSVDKAKNENYIFMIKGKIIDDNQLPLVNAEVRLMNTRLGARTNAKGEFLIANIRANIYQCHSFKITKDSYKDFYYDILPGNYNHRTIEVNVIMNSIEQIDSNSFYFLYGNIKNENGTNNNKSELRIKNTHYATLSNIDGNFFFKIPKYIIHDKIIIEYNCGIGTKFFKTEIDPKNLDSQKPINLKVKYVEGPKMEIGTLDIRRF